MSAPYHPSEDPLNQRADDRQQARLRAIERDGYLPGVDRYQAARTHSQLMHLRGASQREQSEAIASDMSRGPGTRSRQSQKTLDDH